jgi:hypothetical protein
MEREDELVEKIREKVEKFGLDRDEAGEKGLPEELFDLLERETEIPVHEIRKKWIEEGELEEDTESVKGSGFESMEMNVHRTYREQKIVYIPSEKLLDSIYE